MRLKRVFDKTRVNGPKKWIASKQVLPEKSVIILNDFSLITLKETSDRNKNEQINWMLSIQNKNKFHKYIDIPGFNWSKIVKLLSQTSLLNHISGFFQLSVYKMIFP